MGNTEKLAVLLIIFAGILVFAIPFGGNDDEPAGTDPVAAAADRLARKDVAPDPLALGASGAGTAEKITASAPPETARAQAPVHAGEPAVTSPEPTTPDASGLMLDAATTVADTARTVREPEAEAGKRILQTTRGLRPSNSSDYMEYRVRDGDTWTGLAQRFFRDGKYTRNLHLANEGLTELREGRSILVPVFDHLAASGTRAPLRPVRPTAARAARSEAAQPTPAAATGLPRTYVVKEGDILSKISQEVYGTSTRWPDIYEANRDKLTSAHWLKVGTELVIPKIDLSKKPAKAPAPATTTAKTTEKPASKVD